MSDEKMKLSDILKSESAAHEGIKTPWYASEYAVSQLRGKKGDAFCEAAILRSKKRYEDRKALGEWCDRARAKL